MPPWSAPQRPAAYTEEALVNAILDGTYPAGTTLPGERDLAAQLGVTRPTLREVLRRLERDGWLTVRHGKATRVNDFWREGGLNVLEALARRQEGLPSDFVPHLLEVRLALAPIYTHDAVRRTAADVVACLEGAAGLEDTPEAYAEFDWRLHHTLTVASGNPVYTLILNGFAGLYRQMALLYFSRPAGRASSQAFYRRLLQVARQGDAAAARRVAQRVMQRSIMLWQTATAVEPEYAKCSARHAVHEP
jgi:GntR family negative regulator for fad regulon and positive regulator of fabA